MCELVGRATFSLSVDSVRDGGTILDIGTASGSPDVDKRELANRSVTLTSGSIAKFVQLKTASTATTELFDAYRSGLFGTIASQFYPLDEAVQAHIELQTRVRKGASVLIP